MLYVGGRRAGPASSPAGLQSAGIHQPGNCFSRVKKKSWWKVVKMFYCLPFIMLMWTFEYIGRLNFLYWPWSWNEPHLVSPSADTKLFCHIISFFYELLISLIKKNKKKINKCLDLNFTICSPGRHNKNSKSIPFNIWFINKFCESMKKKISIYIQENIEGIWNQHNKTKFVVSYVSNIKRSIWKLNIL